MGVENLFAGSGGKFADAGDAIVADAQSAFAKWGAGAVCESRVDDEDGGVGGRNGVENARPRGCEEECDKQGMHDAAANEHEIVLRYLEIVPAPTARSAKKKS